MRIVRPSFGTDFHWFLDQKPRDFNNSQWLSIKMPLDMDMFGSERLIRIKHRMLNCMLAWQFHGSAKYSGTSL